ncbi:MAG: SDR family NAD(P)-dependent oxidoreductase [Lachnospiraceae bacterium]|nr:SDR family NAD(P)-dependent oxidoreductase [Lachnospiraceae bacterium]
MKIIIVTGASSGIGEEFVRQLDKSFQRIDEIWMIARSKDKMDDIAKELETKTRIFSMDLESKEDLGLLENILTVEKPDICMLVNCAGFGIMGDFSTGNISEQLSMIDLNCKTLTHVTYLCLPYMVRNGRILQVASSAAFSPQANFAVYAATKSYVLSFSRALQEEIRGREIFITSVCPGPVDTPFFERAEKYGHTLRLKKKFSVSPQRVVHDALIAAKKRKSVSVCSLPIKAFHVASKITPHDWLLEIVQYFAGKEKKNEEKI